MYCLQGTRSSRLSPFVLWTAGRGLGDTKGLQIHQYGSPLSRSPELSCFSLGNYSAQLFTSPFYVPLSVSFCISVVFLGG